MSDFCVHIRNVFTLGRSDVFVHIRNVFTLLNEWFCVHIRNVFTLRNDWILCTYKKRIHIMEGVTLVYM